MRKLNKTWKKALITGIAGQDGPYLTKLLISKGYFVFGFDKIKNISGFKKIGISGKGVKIFLGSFENEKDIKKVLLKSRPDEIYNLAAISDLGMANKFPKKTLKINYLGFKKLVDEAVKINSKVRIFQASSSEMFKRIAPPQDELTPLEPRNVYADSKIKAYQEVVKKYRNKGIFICSAFLFNHESPLRGIKFVTRKITSTFARIRHGSEEVLELGNLDAKRDWGFAGDFVKAMWLMLQQKKPQDFVIATGRVHSVREFVKLAAEDFGLKLNWRGKGINECGFTGEGRLIIKVNKNFYRLPEKTIMRGDIKKAEKILGWKPEMKLRDLVKIMVKEDIRSV